MLDVNETRRRFMAHFASAGLGATLAPGVLWARMQDAGTTTVTLEMLTEALKLSGIELSEADRKQMVDSANQTLTRVQELRKIHVPNDVSPPFHFSAIVPGVDISKTKLPFRLSAAPAVKRPASLEDVAFWPVRHLAELVRTRQVTSLELTEMYLARLHRYNAKLNNVVTFLDNVALAEAKRADQEIASGKYKGALHGIPWGAKDIIAVRGHKTTWGSPAFKEQVFDYDASIVELLRDAGAVLIAKLATGELAAGDNWFGGQTKSPWDPDVGSSGSSAGPSSATAAGCVAFAIGTETSGSILSPSARCGLAGLRPTFGRISRHGCMALSWTQDRLGPICRYAEDCAIVMQAVARPDGRDMSVSDVPFNWNAQLDVRKLRVGIIQPSFDEITNPAAKANAQHVLDTLTGLGVTRFIPMTVPDFTTNVSAIGVEQAVFFDEHQRAGRMQEARGGGRPNGRLVSAVDYLQSQRIRMMMMMELAKATSGVDVYLVGSNNTGGTPAPPGGRGRGSAEGAEAGRGAGGRGGRGGGGGNQGPTQRHFAMANLACTPAVNVPNGFAENGQPTNVVFYGRPFGEAEILVLAKAYQDAAQHHTKKPTRLDTLGDGLVLLLIGTRKGGFIAKSDLARQAWTISGPILAGNEVNHVVADAKTARMMFAGKSAWWGPGVQISDDLGATWRETRSPLRFAEGREKSVERVWTIKTDPRVANRVYAGVDPGALFVSDDGGDEWREVPSLTDHETRKDWFPGAGGLMVHSMAFDSSRPSRLMVGLSAAGTFRSDDNGASWTPKNSGVRADFLPDKFPVVGQCVHHLEMHASNPNVLYQQNHCGVYRSEDAGDTWVDISDGLPSRFGFPLAVLPQDGDTIFVVPEQADTARVTPDGAFRVFRSRNRGQSWQSLSDGLPQSNAYVNVMRMAMTTDSLDAPGVYIGTQGGQIVASRDGGDHWELIFNWLPPVYSLETLVVD